MLNTACCRPGPGDLSYVLTSSFAWWAFYHDPCSTWCQNVFTFSSSENEYPEGLLPNIVLLQKIDKNPNTKIILCWVYKSSQRRQALKDTIDTIYCSESKYTCFDLCFFRMSHLSASIRPFSALCSSRFCTFHLHPSLHPPFILLWVHSSIASPFLLSSPLTF